MNKSISILSMATLVVTAIGLAVLPSIEEQANAALKDELKYKADNLKTKAKEFKKNIKDRVGSGGEQPPCSAC